MKVFLLSSVSRISTKAIFILLFLLLLVSLGATATLAYLYTQSKQQQMSANQLSEKEVKAIVGKVGKLIALPDETPTVATVTDKEKLAAQPFFARAENGDKVLIYQTAQKAYLYRPGDHKLIEVAPLTLQTSDAVESSAIQEEVKSEPEFSVAIYNGTPTLGLTNRYQETLVTAFPKASVVSKQNASQSDYSESFIVDIRGGQDELLQQLSSTLKLPIEELPILESTPSAQVLIILGSDRAEN